MSNLGIRLHQAHLGPVRLVSKEDVDALLREASQAGDHKFRAVFLRTEWDQVVDAWQLGTWEAYRDVQRLGRRTRLSEARRVVLWKIFEQVRKGLKTRGLMTESAVFQALADAQTKRPTPAYDANRDRRGAGRQHRAIAVPRGARLRAYWRVATPTSICSTTRRFSGSSRVIARKVGNGTSSPLARTRGRRSATLRPPSTTSLGTVPAREACRST